ncbi:MAG TPA: alpha-hydroxy acid oxidase [Stellaceae bacterium]|nr:alpha-hydroxy acid oxidase [Stellaceae bacterium]
MSATTPLTIQHPSPSERQQPELPGHRSSRLSRVLDLDDFQRAVRRRLPRAVYGYVAHGAETEATMRGNRAVFDEWQLVTRILVGVEERNSRISLFGRDYAAPFGIAPMGGGALVAFDGHLVMARAAAKAGIPFILSANSIVPLEEVAAANPAAWFAAYQSPNREAIEGMVARVARAGIEVLAVTADVPIGSNREYDARAGFSFPIRPGPRLMWDVATHPRWLAGTLARTLLKRGIPEIVNLEPGGGPNLFSRKVKTIAAHESLDWEHVRVMRDLWKGRFVVKGVLSVEDVVQAREIGADGVILSNHGGRQLDYAISPLTILEAAVAAAGDMTVMIDSGFRRGTDIVKALALGARAVFVGRPFLFAAALAAEEGVSHAIALLAKELDTDMALLGRRRIADIGRDVLRPAPPSMPAIQARGRGSPGE